MKLRTLLTITLLSASVSVFAQTGAPAIPEFKNKVHLLSDASTLSDLESADLQSEMKTGMTSAKINFRTSGKTASVKATGKTSVRYIVKLDEGVDPEAAVELFQFDTDKKGRYFLVGSVVMGSISTPELNKRKLGFSKIENGVYVITSKEDLKEGQYAFVVNRPSVGVGGSANVKAYAFEVGN